MGQSFFENVIIKHLADGLMMKTNETSKGHLYGASFLHKTCERHKDTDLGIQPLTVGMGIEVVKIWGSLFLPEIRDIEYRYISESP